MLLVAHNLDLNRREMGWFWKGSFWFRIKLTVLSCSDCLGPEDPYQNVLLKYGIRVQEQYAQVKDMTFNSGETTLCYLR